MDETWAFMLAWCLVAGVMIGFPIGWILRGRRDRKSRRKMELNRIAARRAADARKATADTLRLTRKQRELHDAGRKLPAREGAGPPIKVHKMRVSRSPKPQR